MQVTPQAAPKTSRSDWQKAAESVARNFSTEEFATQLKVQPQTIRAGYCRDGHYLNLRPIKLLNRRLLWPAAEVDALIAGRTVKTPAADDIAAHHARKASNPAKLPAHIARKVAAKAQRPNITTSDEDEALLSGEVVSFRVSPRQKGSIDGTLAGLIALAGVCAVLLAGGLPT